jgi:hypothetical protein
MVPAAGIEPATHRLQRVFSDFASLRHGLSLNDEFRTCCSKGEGFATLAGDGGECDARHSAVADRSRTVRDELADEADGQAGGAAAGAHARRLPGPRRRAQELLSGGGAELRTVLAKYGNDLRQSYRTLAQIAGVSETDAMLLMNHSLPGVNAGYITRQKLLQDHLRRQQEAISTLIMKVARKAEPKSPVGQWLSPRGLVGKEPADPDAA